MKKVILALSLITSISQAGVAELANWTTHSNSVQAVLFEALNEAANADEDSRYPTKQIVRKNRQVSVETRDALISCEARTLGMAMVMSYRCLVKGDITTWTYDSASVQAVIHESLQSVLSQDAQSAYPQKTVKRVGPAIAVDDGATVIACRAGTRGMAQAQSYSCTIQ